MTEPVSQKKVILQMLLSVVLFSANVLIIRGLSLSENIDGWMTSFTRGLAGAIFILALYTRGRGLHLRNLHKPGLILRGILGVITITILYFTILHLGASRAVFINLTYPLWGTLIASFWLREKVSINSVFLLLLAATGLALFFSNNLAHASFNTWDLIAILGAVLAGTTVVLLRYLTRTESAATIYSAQCFITLLTTAPLAFPAFNTTSALAWTLLLIGGVLVAYAQILLTKGFYHLDVARGSALQMLLPIFTAAGAFILFDESFTPLELFGATLTLFATWRISVAR
ncbi:MAG: DMT family transporter [Verrucomicrobiota bacterium]